jgi:hypothetical protein
MTHSYKHRTRSLRSNHELTLSHLLLLLYAHSGSLYIIKSMPSTSELSGSISYEDSFLAYCDGVMYHAYEVITYV